MVLVGMGNGVHIDMVLQKIVITNIKQAYADMIKEECV